MTKTNPELRARWVACVLIAAAFVPSCANQAPASSEVVEVEETTDALTQAEYDCERAKRECLTTADCDAAMRDACESAFDACKEPARAERDRVRELCRAQRETCDAAATDEAGRHACHVAEHTCKLPVDPPEAVCHIAALECIWAARAAAPDSSTPPMKSAAEEACREEERACKESKRLNREDLPKPPQCPPPPPPCTPADPTEEDAGVAEPVEPESSAAESQVQFDCERTKRECLITANCAADLREACESAFRACEEPVRAERKRVRELCRTERETCEASATDEAGRHACHIAEHRCKLPVEPPEAVCRIDAEVCRWAARMTDTTAAPDPMLPPEPNAAEQACRETERTCVEALRMHPEELPKPPHCPHVPPACTPEATP